MKPRDKRYAFSLAVYFAALAAAALSCVFPLGTALSILFFPAVFAAFMLFVRQLRADLGMKLLGRRTAGSGYPAARVVGAVPAPLKALVVFTVIYTVVSFVVNGLMLSDGMPELVDGVPVLFSHGKAAEISWPEFRRLQMAESRLFTGHLLTFSALPFGYFSGIRRLRRQA